MKDGNVLKLLDQFVEFTRVLLVVVKKMWGELEGDVAQHWIVNNVALEVTLRSALLPTTTMLPGELKRWREFYWKHFNIELGEVKIPRKKPEQKDFTRLLVIAKGLTANSVYGVCAKRFPCWRYVNDLHNEVLTNERDPQNGSYAIWVRDVVEADKFHKNKSAKTIKQENLKTETLLERELHELVYFLETGEHLDIQNWTLCSGSRYSDGSVPSAYWNGGRFGVYWRNVGLRDESLRAREVVS